MKLFLLLGYSIYAGSAALAYDLPHFRQPDTALSPPGGQTRARPVRLLADGDFPPFSFEVQGGGPAGLAVELALVACAEARLRCEVKLLPFEQLLPALRSGEGDVVISGVRTEETALDGLVITRPWFRTMARFAALAGNPLAEADAKAMAGKRIGVLQDTSHGRWLAEHYSASEIVAFSGEDKAHTALRTGAIDAYFGDNLNAIYWVAGEASGGCCKLLGGAYSDFGAFSRNFAFIASAERHDLRDAFDFGLDAAQQKGETSRIFNAYVPLSPW